MHRNFHGERAAADGHGAVERECVRPQREGRLRCAESQLRLRRPVRQGAGPLKLPRRRAHRAVHRQGPQVRELRKAHRDAAADGRVVGEDRRVADEEAVVRVAGRMPRRDVRTVQVDLRARAVGGRELDPGQAALAGNWDDGGRGHVEGSHEKRARPATHAPLTAITRIVQFPVASGAPARRTRILRRVR